MKYLKSILILFLLCSCEDIIYVEDISNKTVSIIAPVDESAIETNNVLFSWNSLSVDSLNYKLQIVTPDFETATQVILDTIVKTTSFSKTFDLGTYQWRIRAENSDYQSGYTTQSFSVLTIGDVDISSQNVVLLSPVNDVVITGSNLVNFSWEAIENADNYTIQIARPSFEDEEERILDATVNITSLEKTFDIVGSYEWRIKASNSNYETDFNSQRFSIE